MGGKQAYEDDDLSALVERMRESERRIPVVNHKKELVGIVSLVDIARSDASARLKSKGVEGVS